MIQVHLPSSTADLPTAILAYTEDLFGAPACMTLEWDPELPDTCHLVVHVKTNAEVPEIVRLNSAWHRRLLEVAGDAAIRYQLLLEVT
jgi:hypothetical protein